MQSFTGRSRDFQGTLRISKRRAMALQFRSVGNGSRILEQTIEGDELNKKIDTLFLKKKPYRNLVMKH